MISKRLLAGGALVLLGLMLGTLIEGFGPLGRPKQALISGLESAPSTSASAAIDEAALNGDFSPLPAPTPEPTVALPTPNPTPAPVVSLLPRRRTSPTPRPKPTPTPRPTPAPTPSPTPVDLAPYAAVGVYPSTGLAPLTVSADASGSTDQDATVIANYRFDFGDGTASTTQGTPVMSHIYATPGSYTLKVTVTDSAGLSSEASAPVTVDPDLAPTAALIVDRASGAAPLTVTADSSGSSDGDTTPIATYQFDFGDATVVGPAGGSTATHTYAISGSYTITVTVVDTAGFSSTASATVTVS